MLSTKAEWFLGTWRSDATGDAMQRQDLCSNFRAYARGIEREVQFTREVKAALGDAIHLTESLCMQSLRGSPDTIEKLSNAVKASLDQLEAVCNDAGLSDEARALGS